MKITAVRHVTRAKLRDPSAPPCGACRSRLKPKALGGDPSAECHLVESRDTEPELVRGGIKVRVLFVRADDHAIKHTRAASDADPVKTWHTASGVVAESAADRFTRGDSVLLHDSDPINGRLSSQGLIEVVTVPPEELHRANKVPPRVPLDVACTITNWAALALQALVRCTPVGRGEDVKIAIIGENEGSQWTVRLLRHLVRAAVNIVHITLTEEEYADVMNCSEADDVVLWADSDYDEQCAERVRCTGRMRDPDVIVSFVNTARCLQRALLCLAPGGTVVQMGRVDGDNLSHVPLVDRLTARGQTLVSCQLGCHDLAGRVRDLLALAGDCPEIFRLPVRVPLEAACSARLAPGPVLLDFCQSKIDQIN